MRSSSWSWLARGLAAASIAASSITGVAAHAGEAEDRAEAKRAYAEARKLQQAGKHEEAITAFRRAHDLAPTPVTRLDLARALADRGALREALELASSVPAMPVTSTETAKSKKARAEATTLAAELGERLPKVTLSVADAPEQRVAIDGSEVSKELLASVMTLDPGEHVAAVSRGELTVETRFTLAEREVRTVELQVPPPPASVEPPPEVIVDVPVAPPSGPPPGPAEPPVTQPVAPGSAGITPAVPVLLAAGGAGLVAGAITGGLALSQASDLLLACENDACPPSQADALSTHEATATASTALFVLGGVATAAGLVVWIVDASSGGPSTGASMRVRWAGTGFALEGTW